MRKNKNDKTNEILLTCPDELGWANFTVTFDADGVHSERVVLPAARVGEQTRVVSRPALRLFASVVLGRSHIVVGVVGVLPAEDDHIAGATVSGLRKSWSTGDWGKGIKTLKHN